MAGTDGSGAILSYGGISAGITNISWSGMERDMLEVTALDTTDAKEYIAAQLYDAGEITIDININDKAHLAELTTHETTAQAITLSFNDAAGTAVSFTVNGYVQSMDPMSATTGEVVTASVTFKLSGVAA